MEEIEEFEGMNDFVSTFHFKRGKDDDDEDEPTCGEFKVNKICFASFMLFNLSTKFILKLVFSK